MYAAWTCRTPKEGHGIPLLAQPTNSRKRFIDGHAVTLARARIFWWCFLGVMSDRSLRTRWRVFASRARTTSRSRPPLTREAPSARTRRTVMWAASTGPSRSTWSSTPPPTWSSSRRSSTQSTVSVVDSKIQRWCDRIRHVVVLRNCLVGQKILENDLRIVVVVAVVGGGGGGLVTTLIIPESAEVPSIVRDSPSLSVCPSWRLAFRHRSRHDDLR